MSKSSVIVQLFVVVATVSLSSQQQPQEVTDFYDREYQVCGTALYELVSLACAYLGGVYEPDPNASKRTQVSVFSLPIRLLPRENRWRRTSSKRSRQGIIEECCHQPCKLRTLQSRYCLRMPSATQDGLAHQLMERLCDAARTLPSADAVAVTTPVPTLPPAIGTIWSRTTVPHSHIPVSNVDYRIFSNSKRDYYDIY